MSNEAVDFYVKDKLTTDPVENVVVRIYSQDGATFINQATTDEDGLASFLLPAPVTYQVRFYKFQTGFKNPKYVEVLEEPEAPFTNTFDVEAENHTPPIASDARLCAASGFFRKPNGAPHPFLDMHFVPQFDPILLDGAGLLCERVLGRTDNNGFIRVDLIRFAKYGVLIQGFEDMRRIITVPDAASVNLPDLLFPVVTGITTDPVGPFELEVGAENDLTVDVTLLGSGGSSPDFFDVFFRTADPTIAVVVGSDNTNKTLTIRGLSAGETTLIVERADTSIIRIPNTPLTGQPITITVT